MVLLEGAQVVGPARQVKGARRRIMPVMLASVIVRTMGRPSLMDALRSIADQGRHDLDVLVVDARGDLPRPAATPLPIRWISQGCPLPRSVAAQVGLEAVLTRWAIFLDDDDVLLAGHLDKLIGALGANAQAVLAHTGVELVGHGLHADRHAVFDQAFQSWELLLGNRMPIHAAMFDAQRARAAGLRFDDSLDVYEDWDFWLQLSMLGEFAYVPGVSARYVLGDDSSDAHARAHGDEAYWRVWRKWWPRAPQAWWAQALRAASQGVVLERQLGEARAALERLQRDHHALHLAHRVAGEEASALHALVAAKVHELRASQIDLAQTQHRLAQSQGSLQWTQETLRQTQVAQHQTEETLSQTRATLSQSEATRSQTNATLSQTEATLRQAQATLHQTEAQLQTTRVALATSQIAQQRAADTLSAMTHSYSWRLTHPLRQGVTLVKRVKARAARFKREVLTQQTLLRGSAFRQHQTWIAGPEARALGELSAWCRQHAEVIEATRFSVVMPVFNPDLVVLEEAVNSVLTQWHGNWQLCIADDASTAPGVRERLAAWSVKDQRICFTRRSSNGHIAACTNTALAKAVGDWVVFVDQDDRLAPQALAALARHIAAQPELAFVYSDEDKLDAGGQRCEPHFKPSFSIELLRAQNFVNHLVAYRRSLLLELGGLHDNLDGAQDHDLALRAAEVLRPEQIAHLPQVLYHWRIRPGSTASSAAAKSYASDAAVRAVGAHLRRTEPGAEVESVEGLDWLRVRYPVVDLWAGVAMAAPVRDATWLSRLQGLRGIARLHDVNDGGSPSVLVLREGLWPYAASWLDEMVALLARPGVGVVAGTIFEDGRLAQGALVRDDLGTPSILCSGVAKGKPGAFGAARLVRGCEAVTPEAMLMRRELWPLWQQTLGQTRDERALHFGRSVAEAGWRLLWNPFAAFDQGVDAEGAGQEAITRVRQL